MATVDELVVLIKAQSKDFDKSLKDVENKLGNLGKSANKAESAFSSTFSSIAKTAGNAGAALAGLAAVAAGVMVKGLVDASSQSEKAQLSLAGLINATTQFKTSTGQALGPVENLNASIGRAQELYSELRKQALLLADVETPELLNAATFALPDLTVIGVTEAKQQAELIGTVVASIKQLGIATSEIEQRKEISAFLQGDITGQGVEFAKLVAQVNGGTEAFKQNYQAAVQNGQGFEFLKNSMLAFRAASELSASTLSNKFSVLNDSINLLAVTAGDKLLSPFKELIQLSIDQFFTKSAGGAMEFNKELMAVSQEVGGNFAKVFEAIKPLIEPTFNLIISLTRLVASVFGETSEQSSDAIGGIATTLQSLADFLNAVADRAKSMAMIVTGAFEALTYGIQTSVRAVAGIITGIIETAINAIKIIINTGIKGMNALIQGANFIPGVKLNQIKEFAAGYSNTKIWIDAGKQSGQAYLKGLGKIGAGTGGLFGAGQKTKAFKDIQRTSDGLTATSKANTGAGGAGAKGGKGKATGGPTGGAERGSQAAAEEALRDKQRLDNLRLELGFKQQISALDNRVEAQTQELTVQEAKNNDLIKTLEYETKIAEAKASKGLLSKEEAENVKLINERKILELQNENALLPLQKQKAENAQKLANAQLQLNQKIAESQLALNQGKLSQEEYNLKVEEARLTYQGINAELLSAKTNLDSAIESQLGWNAKALELNALTAVPETNLKGCQKQGTDAMQAIQGAAQSLGQSIAGAFQDGKVSAQEFGQIALNIMSQVISKFLEIGINSAFGGGFGFAGGGVVRAATGGYISGAGTGTSDSIPAMLSNGEFVINAAATRKFGPLLSAINSGRFGKFASGGAVLSSRSPSYSMPSSSYSPVGGNGAGVMININAVDSQGVIEALSKKDVRQHLFATSNQATQRSSNKAFNKSPFELVRGR